MKAQNIKKRRKRLKVVTFERETKADDGRAIVDLASERDARERAAFDETKVSRMERYQVDEKFAKSQECGHVIGRLSRQLKWDSETSSRRIGAGFRFAEIVTEYRKDVLNSPNPNPPAMDMNKIGGLSTREITEDRVKRLAKEFMAIHMALGNAGPAAYLFRLLDMTCIEDVDTSNWSLAQTRDLINALDAVAGC